ncbi:DUF2887 domain-containing protein [Nostoc sp.]|uniref:DUF2887 domain-containing protein n=1 Tax=Nostoc sp. TaxID=1180 RepID=UPI003FA58C0F
MFGRRDAIFYLIFKRVPGLLFELVEQPPAEAASYCFESVDGMIPQFLASDKTNNRKLYYNEPFPIEQLY